MRVATLSEMLEEVVRLGEATGMGEHVHELRGELDGVELLAHLLHPDLIDAPGSIGFTEVRG
jgi:hypothetical protein